MTLVRYMGQVVCVLVGSLSILYTTCSLQYSIIYYKARSDVFRYDTIIFKKAMIFGSDRHRAERERQRDRETDRQKNMKISKAEKLVILPAL